MLRVLRVHNRYQIRGGEEAVFDAETMLLRRHQQGVFTLQVTNNDVVTRSPVTKIGLAASAIWSRAGRQLVVDAIRQHEPHVVHFDNTFPLISPAAYTAAHEAGVAVVQTLHNYRLLCPSATLYRDGHVCEDCLGKTPPYPGVVHGCYRDSRAQTAVVAAMITTHRALGTWSRHVDRYIALTEFARGKLIEGGLPAELLVVKPNFVDSGPPVRSTKNEHFLFIGRLSTEKGLRTLIAAQEHHGHPVHIAGSGSMDAEVKTAASLNSMLQPLGRLDAAHVREEMLSARALVFPSEWYEGFPMTLVEAFAAGLPVITSRLGSMVEIVEDGVTGLHFEPGNAEDLAAKIRWAADHPEEMRRMGENARREYEARYTPERNYDMLMDIYEQAIHHAKNRGG